MGGVERWSRVGVWGFGFLEFEPEALELLTGDF